MGYGPEYRYSKEHAFEKHQTQPVFQFSNSVTRLFFHGKPFPQETWQSDFKPEPISNHFIHFINKGP
jgi:hypothetical protein